MVIYDIYGFQSDNLDGIAEELEAILNLEWIPHSSSFRGDYYKTDKISEESFTLQHNYFELEDEWMQPNFKIYQTLLYVDSTQRAKDIESLILKYGKYNVALLSRKSL
ncbi:MAG: hypothetical protein IAE83_00145 [Anaerolinea sp.]|nr:hypothetical protein [Anaerolinea sp.]